MKKLPAEEEAKIAEQLKKLAQEDASISLPPSLQSSNLLSKLQEQPNLVSMEGGLLTRRRTVYVISTCVAAFLMVIGLTKAFPAMNSAATMTAVSSTAMAMADSASVMDSPSDYRRIVEALRLLSEPQKQSSGSADASGGRSSVEAGEEMKSAGTSVPSASNEQSPTVGEPMSQSAEEEPAAVEEEMPVEEALLEADYTSVLYSSSNNLVSSSGEWVYWLEQDESTTLHLINAETMEEEASISLPEASMVSELAAYSNMVVCIDPYSFATEESVPGITVYLYQLEEDKSASLLNTIAISGIFEQSYLTEDGTLFLASNQWLDSGDVMNNASSGAENTPEEFSKVLPKVYNAQLQEKAAPIPAENIAVIDSPLEPNYLNVVAIDLANGGTACTWSFLGREGTITISDHMMSMITSDGEGGSQLISIDFSGSTVQYRISKSISNGSETSSAVPAR